MSLFPTPWPPQCPPTDAIDAGGPAFRVTKGTGDLERDFKSQYERGTPPSGDECDDASLSFFPSLEGAVHLLRLHRKLGKYIAEGALAPEHGKMKETESEVPNHYSWWPYAGVNRGAIFFKYHEASELV